MSFDGYMGIVFTAIVPAIIAVILESKFNIENKKKYIIRIVGVWVSIFIVATVLYFMTKDNNEEELQDKSIAENHIIETGDQSPAFENSDGNTVIYNDNRNIYYTNTSPEPTTYSVDEIIENKPIIEFDFGEAIRHIHSNELIIKSEIINNKENRPTYSSIYPGVSFSYILNRVRLIQVINGFRDFKCSRTYQFDENEKLTFALIDDDKGEHRLYFYDDVLIRYIDSNNELHDINYDLENAECQWTDLALEESYEFFNGVKKNSEENEFSINTSYDMETTQISFTGIDVMIKAETSFSAEYVTITAVSNSGEKKSFDMYGGSVDWYFKANFYEKGTYTITVTAYDSDGKGVSDEFTFKY